MTTTTNTTTEGEEPVEEAMTAATDTDRSPAGLVTDGLLDDFMAKVTSGDLELMGPDGALAALNQAVNTSSNSASIVTVVLWRPTPGAVNSGMRSVEPVNVQWS